MSSARSRLPEVQPPQIEMREATDGDGSPTRVIAVRDGWARAIGIPAFGLTIPHLAGLFGPLTPSDAWFWFGVVWFVVLAAVVWEGNRALLFFQRRQLDWFDRPAAKIIALVAACTLYTAPVTVALIWIWFRAAQLPVDDRALTMVALTNVICVLFVTHAYETAFLIKGRTVDTVAIADMRRTVTQAQLDALRKQVDPHFLFNSLNTLGALIESDPKAAAAFNIALADVYRFLLDVRELVSVQEERAFTNAYCVLLQMRYGASVTVDETPDSASVAEALANAMVPPTAVQTLVENAVKHTRFSAEEPLRISIRTTETGFVVANPVRPKVGATHSAKVGLKNLDERCRILLGRPLRIIQDDKRFEVTVPVRSAASTNASTS